MLVLQPRISTDTPGPAGTDVWVLAGTSEGRKVGCVVAVMNGMLVKVGICAVPKVGLGTTTTGVAVNMDGVFVGGKKGVGGLNGPGDQPLHDAVKSSSNIE